MTFFIRSDDGGVVNSKIAHIILCLVCLPNYKAKNKVNLLRLFFVFVKGALSSLRQFSTTESPLKMMKKAFYFTFKDLFVLKIFKFLS